MKLIDKYIFKKYIGTFFFAISLLIVVVIIFDLSENVDSFIKHNASWQDVVFHYYIPFIPYFINLFIFLFTFIAVIFFTSKMAGHTEIIAILSSGISFKRFLYPYVVAALLLAGMSLYFSNFLIPSTNVMRREFKNEYMENLFRGGGRNIHLQIGKNEYVYVETYNAFSHKGYRFSWEKYDGNELKYKMLSDVIESDSLTPGRWIIKDYTERFIDGDNEYIVQGAEKDTTFGLMASDLYKVKEDFEEMNFFELRRHINNMKEKGLEGVKDYQFEMHQRFASPIAILILTFIGTALSSRKVRGGMGVHLGLGIVIAFSYILFMSFTKAFAVAGNVPPAIAAWIPNFLYCGLAIYFLKKAPK